MGRILRCLGCLVCCASVMHWIVVLRWQEPAASPRRLKAAFVTLLIARPTPESYTGFLESTTRLREMFALEREYPHVVFYDKQVHEAAILRHAPWVVFQNISKIFGNVRVPEREAEDRSLGYNHMCRFYAMQIFDFNFDLIMRVDDDVFLLTKAPYDPFRLLERSTAVYAYGVRHVEEHAVTRDTLDLPMGKEAVKDMFFNNIFLTKVAWWRTSRVRRFFKLIDDSGGIYRWRWGDAPLQTATLMYFNASVLRLPLLNYVHFSTSNLVVDGDLQCLGCDTALTYLRRHTSNLTQRVLVHRDAFLRDLSRILNTTVSSSDVPLIKLVKMAEIATIWCDGAGRVENIELLPRFCCCSLAPFGLKDELVLSKLRTVMSSGDDVVCPVVVSACDRTHDKCASGLPESPSLCDTSSPIKSPPPDWAELQRRYASSWPPPPRNTARIATAQYRNKDAPRFRSAIGDGAVALSELAARLKKQSNPLI